jgi:hypothetical protein
MSFIQEKEEQTEWLYTGIPDHPLNFFKDIINIGSSIRAGLLHLKKIMSKNS